MHKVDSSLLHLLYFPLSLHLLQSSSLYISLAYAYMGLVVHEVVEHSSREEEASGNVAARRVLQ